MRGARVAAASSLVVAWVTSAFAGAPSLPTPPRPHAVPRAGTTPQPRRVTADRPRPTPGAPGAGHRCLGLARARRLEAQGRLRSRRRAALLAGQRAVHAALLIAEERWRRAHERWVAEAYAAFEAQAERDQARARRRAWLRGLCLGLAAARGDPCPHEPSQVRAGCWEGRLARARELLDFLHLRHIVAWLGRGLGVPDDGGEPWPPWAVAGDGGAAGCGERASRPAAGDPAVARPCEALARRDPSLCPPAGAPTPRPRALARLEPTGQGPRVALALSAPASSACWVGLTMGARGARTEQAVAYTPAGPPPAAVVMGWVGTAWRGLTEGVEVLAEAQCIPWVPWVGPGGLR